MLYISLRAAVSAPVLLFAAFAGPAFAQTLSPKVARGDTVIVTATRDPEDPPVVAEARERLSETPGAVAVVSAESYSKRYAPGIADLLRDVPGVFAQKKWGGDTRLSIRGSGIGNANHLRGTLLAQDGIPFNEADGFGDFQLIDPSIARYTEVYKGGNALRYGGALLGGAINIVTPTGKTMNQPAYPRSRAARSARCAGMPKRAAYWAPGMALQRSPGSPSMAGAGRARATSSTARPTSATRSAMIARCAPMSAAAIFTSRSPDRLA